MKNLFGFLGFIAILATGIIAISTATATAIIYIISYGIDFPLYENIYTVVILNVLSLVVFCKAAYHIITSEK